MERPEELARQAASEELNCEELKLRTEGYQKGTVYSGGFDFRQVYIDPAGNEVEVFYSHTSNEIKVVV